MEGSDLHLIAYYTQDDIRQGLLMPLSSRPDITNLLVQPHLFRLSNLRYPPKIVKGLDGADTMA